MKGIYRLILIVAAISVLVVIFLIAQSIIRVRAQDDLISSLTETLTQEGVPLIDISLLSRSPFQIEFSIQSTRKEGEWSSEDLWYNHITRREAELAYKKGHRLDSYALSVYNAQGELLKWYQKYLYPSDLSQNPYPFNSSKTDDRSVEQLARNQIELYGMSLDSLSVSTGIGSSDDVQLLKIQMSTDDLGVINNAIPDIKYSVQSLAMKLNEAPGGRIAVVWLKIFNTKGDTLLSYLWDLEMHSERGGTAEGVTRWFSEPPGPEEELAPTQISKSTAPPTPIGTPYPEPLEPERSTTQPLYP